MKYVLIWKINFYEEETQIEYFDEEDELHSRVNQLPTACGDKTFEILLSACIKNKWTYEPEQFVTKYVPIRGW